MRGCFSSKRQLPTASSLKLTRQPCNLSPNQSRDKKSITVCQDCSFYLRPKLKTDAAIGLMWEIFDIFHVFTCVELQQHLTHAYSWTRKKKKINQ